MQQQGRARPSRGGRGGQNTSRTPRSRQEYSSVPPYASIQPGNGVSIVLKEDQPTGHQVKGIVSDLLTRGDHPRGVKVRLRDGRVGRVQGLVSETEGERGEALVGGAAAGLGRNGESNGLGSTGRRRGGRIERDIREDDEYLYENRAPAADRGYFAALEEADKRDAARKGTGPAIDSKVVTCPVCGIFEGDEVAVAHHVEQHFGGQ
ncbi:hypothetical protein P153DRAFT_91696 [Dothidotthia symphoricarpi CBS 119687]|uniref:UBZ4-type domain-containing protein n=1 Tax=Dothidotthia symphoricarpi CBS 119687 TaxID=1392245 RepID=A0A6A6A3E9_9PLEO|nr:uncharacterized protein P153DRAFT_91696 [Dothidotthia symphoricarpi CBS 119687]KAF2125705.1 hypothetical protein P153DRAFT_91696 [Dothidotthia symphoricarpi CBS 119687]